MHPHGTCDTGDDAGSHATARTQAAPGRPGRGRLRSRPARAATVLLAAVAALLALPLQAQAQTTGICGRTAAVRTAILGEISGVIACADVTDAHLAAITGTLSLRSAAITALAAGDFDGLTALTWLRLNGNSLSTLPAGVFDELTALTTLYLGNNSLSTLPAGVFDELTALTTLGLQGNPGAPFAPTADALPDDGTVPVAGGTVTLDGSGSDGGPWGTNVTYSWAASGATVTFDDAASATPVVTIPALADDTELTFTLTVTGRATDASYGSAPDTDTAMVTAVVDPTAGICGRTEQVRTAIVALVSGVTACADVTDAHLAAITGTLRLGANNITVHLGGDVRRGGEPDRGGDGGGVGRRRGRHRDGLRDPGRRGPIDVLDRRATGETDKSASWPWRFSNPNPTRPEVPSATKAIFEFERIHDSKLGTVLFAIHASIVV